MSKATFDPTRYNPSDNTPFAKVLDRLIERRTLIRSGGAMTALSVMAGFGMTGCKEGKHKRPHHPGNKPGKPGKPMAPILGFESVAGSKTDAVVVPSGYRATVIAPWGTPLNKHADEWKEDGTNTARDQLNSVGMHHDGMHFYPLPGNDHDGILMINHEYVDQDALHPQGPTSDPDSGKRTVTEEIRKEIYGHGVTAVRIRKKRDGWHVIFNDRLNRRFTAVSEMEISGPLARHKLLKTRFSPDGATARGTLNNCGSGTTPWGTFLSAEENWPDYFVNRGERTPDQLRLGIPADGTRYGWDDLAGDATEQDDEFARFDVTPRGKDALEDYRNEANGQGYIVEFDPYDPDSYPVKRTALGRFRHENCEVGKLTPGKPVVFYSGHDARYEYIYKFVSDAPWNPADAKRTDRLAVGAKYMDAGTLYVARFDDDGHGEWIPLTLDTPALAGGTLEDTFEDLGSLILNTPGAADLVGATPMDRPEWAAVDPINGTVYMTLTNNSSRTESHPANPRLKNNFGHIIRWNETDDVTRFTWDIYLFGAPADADAGTNLSGLTDLNQFASPDGLVYDPRGILWIQTDNGAEEITEVTNDQMLAIVPAALADPTGQVPAIDGSNQKHLKRFFVGPNDSEVTGLAFSPSFRSFFVNIQHPGNWPWSTDATQETPEGTSVRPRSTTVIIEKIDGGLVGF